MATRLLRMVGHLAEIGNLLLHEQSCHRWLQIAAIPAVDVMRPVRRTKGIADVHLAQTG